MNATGYPTIHAEYGAHIAALKASYERDLAELRARVVELTQYAASLDEQLIAASISTDAARVTRLREALENIGDAASYPIDDYDAFHEAITRARRALEADRE